MTQSTHRPFASGASHWHGFLNVVLIAAMLLVMAPAPLATAVGETPAQTFFLSMPEDQVRIAFDAVSPTAIGNTMVSITSIAVTVNGTIIYYDQWEDGYEAASTTPAQASTLIFGDGNTANGNACTYAATLCTNDVLTAGAVLVLRNNVPSNPRGTVTYFDAHDKVAVTQLVAVTRALWDSNTGTVLAGAIQVYDTTGYGTDFRLPVGENLNTMSTNMFEYASLLIMAANAGTTVSIDADGNGTTDYTATLGAGGTYMLSSTTGGVTLNSNAHITSNLPIQVNMITGDIDAQWENRWFNIPPINLWGSSYVTPVGSPNTTSLTTNVFIYNPNSTLITVYAQTTSGTTNFSVAAGATYRYTMPANSGARFYTTGATPPPFLAIGTVDSGNTSWDWGYTLIAEEQLAPMLAVGWAPGSSDLPPANNGSPVWVSAAAATTVYVDYDGNPATGPLTDPNGNHYNVSYTVTALQSTRIYDPDKDQTGMRVYTVDGTLLAAAWGEDPSVAGTNNPYMDMGYVVFPLPQMSVTKTGVLDVTFTAPTDKANAGDKINYTIVATNTGTRILHNVTIVDAKLGTLSCTPAQPVATLAAGASVVCTGSYTLTQADVDAGVVYNTANGDSNETPVITVQEDVPIPLVSVTKTANPTSMPETGGDVTFTFTVLNSSPVETFKIVSLTDSVYGTLAGDADCQVGTVLPVGGTCNFTITRHITGDYPGSHTNTFTVVGSDSKGNLMTASDPETVTITDVVPQIDIVKSVSVDGGAAWVDANTAPGPFLQSGTNPQFKFVVTNSGSVALGSLTLSDPNFAAFYQADLTTPCAIPTMLAPAASFTCYAASAWAAGQHTNTATATGSFTDSVGNVETGTDSDSANYFGAVPALTLTKSATPGTYDAVGQTITYNYVIKNTGNVDLSGPFSVTDDKATVTCTQPGDGLLSPNEEMSCTATYTVTQADLDASNITNKAIATNGTVTSNQATATVYAVAHPNLLLVKTASPATYDHVGQTVSYEYVVTNIGNVALRASYAVTDDMIKTPAVVTCPQTPDPLPVGSSITCSASYAVTQADLDAGSVTNHATATATFGGNTVTSNQAETTVNATQNRALAIDKTAQETTYVKVGDVIHYSYLVTNAGNVTLHDAITVSDNKTTATCPALGLTGLAPGASITCSATYTIQQSDLDAGSLTNVASATSGTTTSPTDTVKIPATQTPDLSLVKHASPATYNQAGQTIAYTYDLTNNGNVTLSGPFTVDDDKATVTCPPEVTSLAVNDTVTCTASHTVTQGEVDGGSITNVAKGHAFFGTTPVDSNQDTKTVTAEKNPALTIVKTATPGTYDAVNDVISYQYLVTNSGNVTLYNISVVDDKAADESCPDTSFGLAPGASISCTASYAITQEDLDTGSVTNSAYATDGTTSSAPDSETVNAIQQGGLGLSKSADPTTYDSVGDVIVYTYVIKNTGNITLAGPFSVNDDHIGTPPNTAFACGSGPLAPQATTTCTASYTITQADLDNGSVTNVATASGNGQTSNPAQVTVAGQQTPALAIDKTAQETTYAKAGDVIHYSYQVTNAGNVTLSGPFTVNDDKATDESCPATASLAPGASITCTASHTVTQPELDAGSLTNVASATNGTVTSPSDTVTVPAAQSPKLTLKKSVSPLTYTTLGQEIAYDYLLTNSGNVTLSGPFAVSDDKATVECPAAVTSLAPGDTLNCTATYTITQPDLNSGSVTNIATATAKFGETTVTSNQDTATVTAVQNPELTLVKSASPSTYAAAGQTISYSYVVQNSGNVTLAGPFTVADSKASVTCPATASLAPGASITCSASYVVSQADLDNGSVTNIAKAKGSFGGNDVFSNEDSETVNAVPAPALSLVKSATPSTYDAVDDAISYSYVLKNIGNVTLAKPFSVTDDKAATVTCPQPNTLAVGAEITCNATYRITQADLDAGLVTNIATGHAQTLGGTPVNSNDASATVNAERKPALTIVKTATPTTYDAVDDVISYSYLVTNSGNVTLHEAIVVSDDKATDESCPALPAEGLAPGESITCSASYKITQADLDGGSVTNVASATSGTTVSPTDTETVTADKKPALSLVKTATPATYSAVGDTISYSYLVKSTGNVTLAGPVTVADDKAAVTCPAGGLAPGAEMTCTASYIITQADLDSGSVKNTAKASANGTDSNTDDETVTAVQSPALSLVKTASPATYSAVGDVISYMYVVQNTGNVTLAGPVTVADDKATVTCPAVDLAPGASMPCTASYTITQADLDSGSVKNTAKASANGTDSNTDDETVTAVQSPALSLVKTATPATYSAVGDVIAYNYVVKNTGNVTLAGPVTVADDKAAVTCPAGGLVPGASITCTASYNITQADLDSGSVKNTAKASANGTDSNTDDETVTADKKPALSLVKTATPATYDHVGQTISYSYLVKNTGNVTLAGPVTVADDKATVTCPAGGLAPGASTTCTASYTISQANLNFGLVKNIAQAHANGTDSNFDDETVNAIQSPALSLDKTTTTTTFAAVGDLIAYSYELTNSGNVTLSGPFTVGDNKATVDCSPAPASLAPGDATVCTATYVAAQDDLDAGFVTNIAQAHAAFDGKPVDSNKDSVAVNATQNPHLSLTKVATEANFNAAGVTLHYTLVATNDGNVTLHDVFISDPKLGALNCTQPVTLAPNATLTCTGSHTVDQADLDAGKYENTGSVSGKGPQDQPVSATASASVPAAQNPHISLTKSANPTTYSKVGDVIAYSYVVKNTGNVTLPGPFSISDDKLGTISCPTGSLAPDASVTCTASYTIKQSDLDAGSIVNKATASTTYGGKTISSNEATATVTAVQSPAISLTKSASPATYKAVGDIINYTLVAKNMGNVTLHNVSITDPKLGTLTCTPAQPATLAPNATLSCTGTYTIKSSDLVLGKVNKVTNTATVNGKGPQDQPVSATATATVYQQTGVLLPTQTTCQMYKAGPSAWPPMYDAFTYQVKSNKISSVSPGVIFYYNTITAPSAGFALNVVEGNTLQWKAMLWQDAGQAILYDANCNKFGGTTVTATGGTTSPYAPYTMTFTVTGATPGATYYIGIKYSPQNLIGQGVSRSGGVYPTNTYSFSTAGEPGSGTSIRVAPKK